MRNLYYDVGKDGELIEYDLSYGERICEKCHGIKVLHIIEEVNK